VSVDPDVVQQRLRLMRALLADLDGLGDVAVERLEHDRIVRHAVERILTQLVELAVSVNGHVVAGRAGAAPSTYRESFAAAADVGVLPRELADELAPSAGLRNVLTHEYVAIDLALVARGVVAARSGYARYLTEVARFLTDL
jgi:uncharacterized protein YutE (UPF0331/DUF86 family)